MSSISWFTIAKWLLTARTRPGKSQMPTTSSWSPVSVTGTQVLDLSSTASQTHQQGALLKMNRLNSLNTRKNISDTLMWNTCISVGCLTRCARGPALPVQLQICQELSLFCFLLFFFFSVTADHLHFKDLYFIFYCSFLVSLAFFSGYSKYLHYIYIS